MPILGKSMLWPKLRSSLRSKTCTGGSTREEISNLPSKLNVDKEYMEAFRTKSYTEMWSKVQSQLRKTNPERLSSFSSYRNISENLLEPQQEVVICMINTSSDIHDLLIDYFEGSLEACRVCGLFLQIIHQTRVNYCMIQRVIKLTRRVSNFEESDVNDGGCKVIFAHLASFSKLDNPVSSSRRLQLNEIQIRYRLMLDKLRAAHKRTAKKAKLVYLWKRALGISLVVTCITISTVTLVLAFHSIVGVAAAPGLVTVSLATIKTNIKSTPKKFSTSILKGLVAQLDTAEKGAYILNHDFDTLNQLVTRLYDEIESRRFISELCVKSQKRQMLIEAVKEFKTHESCFLELIGELEEHVYLCFLNINRARRLVIEETMVNKQNTLEDS